MPIDSFGGNRHHENGFARPSGPMAGDNRPPCPDGPGGLGGIDEMRGFQVQGRFHRFRRARVFPLLGRASGPGRTGLLYPFPGPGTSIDTGRPGSGGQRRLVPGRVEPEILDPNELLFFFINRAALINRFPIGHAACIPLH